MSICYQRGKQRREGSTLDELGAAADAADRRDGRSCRARIWSDRKTAANERRRYSGLSGRWSMEAVEAGLLFGQMVSSSLVVPTDKCVSEEARRTRKMRPLSSSNRRLSTSLIRETL